MMRNCRGFTLIELMIVVVVVALLAAVGYPSYRDHIARGQRSQGQQFLSDFAQRQEQFLLDRRQYADTLQTLRIDLPTGMKYTLPAGTDVLPGVNNAANPPSFFFCLTPTAGTYLAARNDGRICINNRNERWREGDNNNAFDNGTDCAWENRSCKLSGEG